MDYRLRLSPRPAVFVRRSLRFCFSQLLVSPVSLLGFSRGSPEGGGEEGVVGSRVGWVGSDLVARLVDSFEELVTLGRVFRLVGSGRIWPRALSRVFMPVGRIWVESIGRV